jgi:hypothetical protein
MREADDCWGVNWGEMDPFAQEILIDADRPPHRQLEVLLHEILHAAWEAYDMPARATEEQVAAFVGRALAAVIRANPKLLTVLSALRDGAGFLGD